LRPLGVGTGPGSVSGRGAYGCLRGCGFARHFSEFTSLRAPRPKGTLENKAIAGPNLWKAFYLQQHSMIRLARGGRASRPSLTSFHHLCQPQYMRKHLTQAELLRYSDEHLLHEFNMLWQTAAALSNSTPGLLTSALIESFAIHARNLIEFLCTHPEDGYVAAEHFFDDPGEWPTNMPPTLGRLYGRASAEVSHLTTNRQSGTPPQKDWDIAAAIGEIEPIAKDFATRASDKRLGPKVRQLFQQPAPQLKVWLDANAMYSNVATGFIKFP